eukprot:Gb_16126 [translate_table: standard]
MSIYSEENCKGLSESKDMAELQDGHHPSNNLIYMIRRIRDRSPNPTQMLGLVTALMGGGSLLVLMAIALSGSIGSFVLLSPFLVVFSPILVPVGLAITVSIAGFLNAGAMGAAGILALLWIYRYVRGQHPAGSDKFDYARTRLAEAANQLKKQARDCAGYLQHKVRAIEPGA